MIKAIFPLKMIHLANMLLALPLKLCVICLFADRHAVFMHIDLEAESRGRASTTSARFTYE
jgi:hypothetical protein